MTRAILFLTLIHFVTAGFTPASTTTTFNCPAITNLQKTGETSSTFSCAWNHPDNSAVEYKVWYVRTEGDYFSGYFYTTNKSYTFSGLSSGHHTFYIQAVCSSQTSEFIGIEDVIGA